MPFRAVRSSLQFGAAEQLREDVELAGRFRCLGARTSLPQEILWRDDSVEGIAFLFGCFVRVSVYR